MLKEKNQLVTTNARDRFQHTMDLESEEMIEEYLSY